MPRRFLALAGGFVWTRRGLLVANELRDREEILGVDSRGSCSWESVGARGKQRDAKFELIVTDHCASAIAGESRVSTTRGPVRAQDLQPGNIVELAVVPKIERKEEPLGSSTLRDSFGDNFKVDAGLCYLFGLQKRVRRVEGNSVWISCVDRQQEIRVAQLVDGWLTLQGRRDRILFGQGRVAIRSPVLADLCNLYGSLPPPREVRCSTGFLASFLKGYSESSIMINNNEEPRTYFQLPLRPGVATRFVLLAMRFFGIEPEKLGLLLEADGGPLVDAFVRETDFGALASGRPGEARGRQHNFSAVRGVFPLEAAGVVMDILGQDEHWSPIVESMPVYAIR